MLIQFEIYSGKHITRFDYFGKSFNSRNHVDFAHGSTKVVNYGLVLRERQIEVAKLSNVTSCICHFRSCFEINVPPQRHFSITIFLPGFVF